MEAAIPLILQGFLSLLSVAAPSLTSTSIGPVITALETIIPAAISTGTTLAPVIREIVGLIKGTEDITPDQIVQCEAMSTQIDAAFDAEADRAIAEDAAAAAAATPKPPMS